MWLKSMLPNNSLFVKNKYCNDGAVVLYCCHDSDDVNLLWLRYNAVKFVYWFKASKSMDPVNALWPKYRTCMDCGKYVHAMGPVRLL